MSAVAYRETGCIRETARCRLTSPQVVRKWLRRFQLQGQAAAQHLFNYPLLHAVLSLYIRIRLP